jgi:hypothetical protein
MTHIEAETTFRSSEYPLYWLKGGIDHAVSGMEGPYLGDFGLLNDIC